ncbi:class I SAM-dependent methyltransferase [Kitasatospora sp. NPDC017646]|uniref:class I SAM-dependent methyltransferase n=1 Tax=Kitasatospora sp. NPDC017646 TaxID=3364024 RepID=UPI0037A303C6
MLDVGCGTGVPVVRSLAAAGHRVTGVDISDVQVQRARELVPEAAFVRADATTLAFPSGTFDAVICLYALIHIPVEEQPALLKRIACGCGREAGSWSPPGTEPGPGPTRTGSVAEPRCGGVTRTRTRTGPGCCKPACTYRTRSSSPRATAAMSCSGHSDLKADGRLGDRGERLSDGAPRGTGPGWRR